MSTVSANTNHRYVTSVGYNNQALHNHHVCTRCHFIARYHQSLLTAQTATCLYTALRHPHCNDLEPENGGSTCPPKCWYSPTRRHNPGDDNLNLQEGFPSQGKIIQNTYKFCIQPLRKVLFMLYVSAMYYSDHQGATNNTKSYAAYCPSVIGNRSTQPKHVGA
jgi:hypothetical protein